MVKLSGVENGGGYLYRPGKVAERVYLNCEGQQWRLHASLYPASTARQADRFSEYVNKERFLALLEDKWSVRPNLNFSFAGRKLLWATTTCSIGSYFEYFFAGNSSYGRKRFDSELTPSLTEHWQRQGLISQENREQIEHYREHTNYQFLDVNPEFEVVRDWDRETVMGFEEQGELVAEIMDAIEIPLSTWGERLTLRS